MNVVFHFGHEEKTPGPAGTHTLDCSDYSLDTAMTNLSRHLLLLTLRQVNKNEPCRPSADMDNKQCKLNLRYKTSREKISPEKKYTSEDYIKMDLGKTRCADIQFLLLTWDKLQYRCFKVS